MARWIRNPFWLGLPAFLLLLALPAKAGGECRKEPFGFGPGVSQIAVRWQMARDGACSQSLAAFKATTIINGIYILQHPANGRVGVAGRASFAYKPGRGFVGQDQFRIRLLSMGSAGPGDLTVLVTVDVADR